jgi:hypothetical protein
MLFTFEYILQETQDIQEGRRVTFLFRQNLTDCSNLHCYVQNKSSLLINKCTVFL